MLVSNTVYKNRYVANGTTTSFPISFPFLDNSHILVLKQVDENTTETVDSSLYTVTGAGVAAGGSVDFKAAPTSGIILAIVRNVPITQLYQYTELDNFPAKSHENSLAKLTMISQELKEETQRAIKVPVTSTETPEQFTARLFTAVDSAEASQVAAAASQVAAKASELSAAGAAAGAAASEANAMASEVMAKDSSDAAAASETAAAASSTTAATMANNASISAGAAKVSEAASKASETAAAGSEASVAANAASALASKEAAAISQTAALISQNAAKDSETASAVSELAAKASETAAANSETNAARDAASALAIKDASAISAAAALASQNAAKISETAAATSATAAKASETAAATSAANALTSKNAAATSASTATTKAGEASASATAAKASETAALASKNAAAENASTASTKATASANSASAALASQNAAKTSETAAAASASTATTKAGEASASATAAKDSETSALASAETAANSATVAQAAKAAAEAARDEAQDLANVGYASQGHAGLAKVDGQTTQANAGGVITVKDVAIGGNLGDLASARGQIGDPRYALANSSLNDYTKSGQYFVPQDGSIRNTPYRGCPGWLSVSTSGLFVKQEFVEFSAAKKKWMRATDNKNNPEKWGVWTEILTTASLGDGLRITNGKLSVPEYDGATASAAGTSGLVPPAAAGQQESFLTGGGEYKHITTLGYPVVTMTPKVATGRPTNVSLSAPAVLLPSATVTAYHVSVDGGPVQDVTAVNNAATFTFTPAGAAGTTATLKVTATDSVGNVSLETTATAEVVNGYVMTPTIISPIAGANLYSTPIPVVTSAFSVFGTDDTHASTDWKITSDEDGNTVVSEALASSDLLAHSFPAITVTQVEPRHLWARHNGQNIGPSDWGHVAVNINPSRHGEILYDTSNNPAAVITGSYLSGGTEPWCIRGRYVWLAFALASKRGVDKTWNLSSSDSNYVDITTIEKPGTSWKLAANNTAADGSGSYVSALSTEAHMDASFTYTQTVKTSKELTDAILTYNASYMAAQFCRTATLKNLGAMDLPSIDVLMRLYQARTIVDALDPTASANTAKKLSAWGFGSANGAYVWSASEYTNDAAWSVGSVGNLVTGYKLNRYGCVPSLEIPA